MKQLVVRKDMDVNEHERLSFSSVPVLHYLQAVIFFIKMADVFIAEANQLCEVKDPDHQLVNAALLYASARFSAFTFFCITHNSP
jgi:hypothetical protein